MPARRETFGTARRIHRHAWLWEPLETDPRFLLRTMFGANAVYLDGKLMLCFCDRQEPWRGVLVCTEREHHTALRETFPALAPHPILPKWLYLPEAADMFESAAQRLVSLAHRRDRRLGIAPKGKPRKTAPSRVAVPKRPRSRVHP